MIQGHYNRVALCHPEQELQKQSSWDVKLGTAHNPTHHPGRAHCQSKLHSNFIPEDLRNMPKICLHCKRQCTYVGSSETVLVSSISCACLNHGNFASTGFFSDRGNKNRFSSSSKIKAICKCWHYTPQHFTLPIDLMLLNKDTLDNKPQFTRKFLHDI